MDEKISFKLKESSNKQYKLLFAILKTENINFTGEEVEQIFNKYKYFLDNHEFTLIIDTRSLKTYSPRIIWEKLPLFMSVKQIAEKKIKATIIITSYTSIVSIVNSIVKVYPSTRPCKVVKNNKDAFTYADEFNKN